MTPAVAAAIARPPQRAQECICTRRFSRRMAGTEHGPSASGAGARVRICALRRSAPWKAASRDNRARQPAHTAA
jgi:hypothetical protein